MSGHDPRPTSSPSTTLSPYFYSVGPGGSSSPPSFHGVIPCTHGTSSLFHERSLSTRSACTSSPGRWGRTDVTLPLSRGVGGSRHTTTSRDTSESLSWSTQYYVSLEKFVFAITKRYLSKKRSGTSDSFRGVREYSVRDDKGGVEVGEGVV